MSRLRVAPDSAPELVAAFRDRAHLVDGAAGFLGLEVWQNDRDAGERERYGPAGAEWCRHDCQHLLNWAVLSLTVELDFDAQLAWLAGVLEARDFPLDRLARCLELLAQAVRDDLPDEPEVAARVDAGAAYVRVGASVKRS